MATCLGPQTARVDLCGHSLISKDVNDMLPIWSVCGAEWAIDSDFVIDV